MIIKCMIIEDEPLAREKLELFIQRVPTLSLAASCSSAAIAQEQLNQSNADLLFLDVQLGESTGIDLLNETGFKGSVILTTAFVEYAVDGYNLDIDDFLLKPYHFNRFQEAVNKAIRNILSKRKKVDGHLFVKTEHRLERIDLSEVLYIEGMRDYRRIHLVDRRIMTLQTFGELVQLIDPRQICRVHKSYMVGTQKIESIERNRIKIKDKYIPVSDTYRALLYNVLNIEK